MRQLAEAQVLDDGGAVGKLGGLGEKLPEDPRSVRGRSSAPSPTAQSRVPVPVFVNVGAPVLPAVL